MVLGGVGSPELTVVLVYAMPALILAAALLLIAWLAGRAVRKGRDAEKDALDKLARLRELHEGGVLTAAEYEDWKRDILERAGRR